MLTFRNSRSEICRAIYISHTESQLKLLHPPGNGAPALGLLSFYKLWALILVPFSFPFKVVDHVSVVVPFFGFFSTNKPLHSNRTTLKFVRRLTLFRFLLHQEPQRPSKRTLRPFFRGEGLLRLVARGRPSPPLAPAALGLAQSAGHPQRAPLPGELLGPRRAPRGPKRPNSGEFAPSEHPMSKIGSNMGGEFTYPKMVPLVLTHSHRKGGRPIRPGSNMGVACEACERLVSEEKIQLILKKS